MVFSYIMLYIGGFVSDILGRGARKRSIGSRLFPIHYTFTTSETNARSLDFLPGQISKTARYHSQLIVFDVTTDSRSFLVTCPRSMRSASVSTLQITSQSAPLIR